MIAVFMRPAALQLVTLTIRISQHLNRLVRLLYIFLIAVESPLFLDPACRQLRRALSRTFNHDQFVYDDANIDRQNSL